MVYFTSLFDTTMKVMAIYAAAKIQLLQLIQYFFRSKYAKPNN